jgi:hypothetical protein
MATVSVAGDNLVVAVTGIDRLYALNKRQVTVPLEHVVTIGPGERLGRPIMPGIPWLANSFPGVFTVGPTCVRVNGLSGLCMIPSRQC